MRSREGFLALGVLARLLVGEDPYAAGRHQRCDLPITLVVPSLDRLGRSIQDLIAIVSGLRKRGIGFQSLPEALDTTTPGGRLVFHVFAALAEFIRELIVHDGNS
jgi:DNA invertase Pin-like site-specific DNA recombinase